MKQTLLMKLYNIYESPRASSYFRIINDSIKKSLNIFFYYVTSPKMAPFRHSLCSNNLCDQAVAVKLVTIFSCLCPNHTNFWYSVVLYTKQRVKLNLQVQRYNVLNITCVKSSLNAGKDIDSLSEQVPVMSHFPCYIFKLCTSVIIFEWHIYI